MKNISKILLILVSSIFFVGCNTASDVVLDLNGDGNGIQGAYIAFNEQNMEMEVMMFETLPDGSVMGATGADNEIMIIYFDENTVFEIHEISGSSGDENVEIKIGEVHDLSLSRSVTVYGDNQSERFVANLVKIWLVVD